MAAASLLSIGLTTPALAHPDYGYQSQHDYDHDRLNRQRDDEHDYLDDVHSEAHEEGLSYLDHRRLHRALNREHARDHRDLRREHRSDHWRSEWNSCNGGRPGDRYYEGY